MVLIQKKAPLTAYQILTRQRQSRIWDIADLLTIRRLHDTLQLDI
jgi:hypothetical protein